MILAFYDVRRAKITSQMLDGTAVKDVLKTKFRAERDGGAMIDAIFVGAEHIDEVCVLFILLCSSHIEHGPLICS